MPEGCGIQANAAFPADPVQGQQVALVPWFIVQEPLLLPSSFLCSRWAHHSFLPLQGCFFPAIQVVQGVVQQPLALFTERPRPQQNPSAAAGSRGLIPCRGTCLAGAAEAANRLNWSLSQHPCPCGLRGSEPTPRRCQDAQGCPATVEGLLLVPAGAGDSRSWAMALVATRPGRVRQVSVTRVPAVEIRGEC